jgi:hypothetical protein
LAKTPAQAKLWPIDAGAKAVESIVEPPTSPLAEQVAADAQAAAGEPTGVIGSASDAPKKKRKRTRKRKKPAGEPQGEKTQ